MAELVTPEEIHPADDDEAVMVDTDLSKTAPGGSNSPSLTDQTSQQLDKNLEEQNASHDSPDGLLSLIKRPQSNHTSKQPSSKGPCLGSPHPRSQLLLKSSANQCPIVKRLSNHGPSAKRPLIHKEQRDLHSPKKSRPKDSEASSRECSVEMPSAFTPITDFLHNREGIATVRS